MHQMSDPAVAQEVALISNPDKWPLWPFLPMKRLGHVFSREGHGFLHNNRMRGPHTDATIYMGHLSDVDGPIKDRETKKYDSIEAMVRDGWVVD